MEHVERLAKAQRRATAAFCVAAVVGGVTYALAAIGAGMAFKRLVGFLEKSS